MMDAEIWRKGTMFNAIKFNALRWHRTSVLGVLFFAVVMVLLPISAKAQCTNWDAGGEWSIIQRGQKYPISFNLEQKGRVLTGTASNAIVIGRGGTSLRYDKLRTLQGPVDGTIDSDNFSVQIFWGNGDTGVYNGKVLPSGRLDGEGYEKRSPNVRVPWHSQGVLKCLPPAKPTPTKIPPKAPPSSKQPTAQPTKTEPPPPMKVPGIIASQVIFESVGAPLGFVFLTWDGGPDHPYAEIWFKVNGGEETFVVEQGKGERRVTVERGKLYEYILTDAGKTLATVSFIGPPF